MLQHNKTVEPKIGGFINQFFIVATDFRIARGQQGFYAFFSDFFENFIQAFGVQASHIGVIGRGALAGFQCSSELFQDVTAAECPIAVGGAHK